MADSEVDERMVDKKRRIVKWMREWQIKRNG